MCIFLISCIICSALAVRFATKRFIGEYDCSTDRIYRVDNHLGSSWEIADPPGSPPTSAEPKLRWADVIVLVYSVTDRVSFDETSRLRYAIYSRAFYSNRKEKINILYYKVSAQGEMTSRMDVYPTCHLSLDT